MTASQTTRSEASTNAGDACRVLVVGDAALEKLVRQTLFEADVPATFTRVEDYLMALGHAAGEAPSVVVGRVQGVDDSGGSIAAGLRRLAPGVRLVLVVRPDEEPDAVRAVAEGFDDYLLEPVDPDELVRVINNGGMHGVKSETVEQEALPPAESVAAPALRTDGPLMNAIDLAGDAPTTPAAIDTPPEDLGDVDLIEQLLRHHPGLHGLAMKMIGAQCKVSGVAWSDSAAGVPDRHAVVPVEFQGVKLGFLHAPAPASTVEMASWAGWLARWVALERRIGELNDAAMKDELTGLWNRRYFNQTFDSILARAAQDRSRVTLLVFDIDDFKSYNDRYGHPAGDEILRQAARLMQSVVRTHDVVARIGGDEFAVLFWDAEGPRQPNSQHPQSVLDAARRFQRAICEHRFPKLLDEAPGTLTISGGLAGYPWDGRSPRELIELADSRALQSKRQGKNAITFGPGAEQTCAYLPK